jgi:hypothetical protein
MLPTMTADSWYRPWLAHPRGHRAGRHPGRPLDGACPGGEPLGLLDQGAAFMPASGRRSVLLVGDETAAPAIEEILRSPDPLMGGRALIEVLTRGDIRSWAHPAGIEVTWTLRQRSDHPTGCPGEAALQYVASHAAVPDNRSGWGGRRRASSPAPTGRGDVVRGGGLQPGGDTGAPDRKSVV